MNTEKIFWGLTAFLIFGFFAFLAVSAAVQPVNASQQQAAAAQQTGNSAQQSSGANEYYAPYGQDSQAALAAAPSAPSAQVGQAAPVNNNVQSGQAAPANSKVQEVTLTVQGGNYMPNPIRVKKGVPVRITADLSSVRGCASGIVIPEFGIRKTMRSGDNTIEFTPGKSGTFSFSCSMGMYRGTIIVEEADGTVASFTGSAKPVASGSCGGAGGSGGCGCGGAAPKAAAPSKGGCGCGGA